MFRWNKNKFIENDFLKEDFKIRERHLKFGKNYYKLNLTMYEFNQNLNELSDLFTTYSIIKQKQIVTEVTDNPCLNQFEIQIPAVYHFESNLV